MAQHSANRQIDLRAHVAERCARHAAQVMRDAELLTHPFPHVLVRDFFPADIYRDLLVLLPPKGCYEPFEYNPGATEQDAGTRWRIELRQQLPAALEPRMRQFWLGIRDALSSPTLKQAVFQKMSPGLGYRYSVPPQKAVDLPGHALPALFREEVGYRIKPHPDTRKKVVTMQISLPADDSQEHLGTEFYRRSLNPLSLAREPRGFEITKTTPFLPNAAYAFVVLNTLRLKSWHGRSRLGQMDGVRNSILNIWYERPQQENTEPVETPQQLRRAA